MRDRLEALRTAVSINRCVKERDDFIFLPCVPCFSPVKLPSHASVYHGAIVTDQIKITRSKLCDFAGKC